MLKLGFLSITGCSFWNIFFSFQDVLVYWLTSGITGLFSYILECENKKFVTMIQRSLPFFCLLQPVLNSYNISRSIDFVYCIRLTMSILKAYASFGQDISETYLLLAVDQMSGWTVNYSILHYNILYDSGSPMQESVQNKLFYCGQIIQMCLELRMKRLIVEQIRLLNFVY